MEPDVAEVPLGVSVWREPLGQRIVAAAYVWDGGFEWCHVQSPIDKHPAAISELALIPGREYFPLADDEKTAIVGSPGAARRLLRSIIGTQAVDSSSITFYSWPEGQTVTVDAEANAKPIADRGRANSEEPTEPPWEAPELFPARESPRIAKYRRLQSRYRHEVLGAKPGAYKSYETLGSYLDADAVAADPDLNFMSEAAARHAEERELVVRSEGGSLDPIRLRHNMLSSMPLCFNLFGTMRAEPDSLGVFQELFDPDATTIRDIVCEWAPQPPSTFLGDMTAFDAAVFYDTLDGSRFIGIETKYTEPFSQRQYESARYNEVTSTSGWFRDPANSPETLKLSKSNQLWRNLLLAASVEAEGSLGTGRVAVVALADDPGAAAAIEIIRPALTDESRLLWVPLEALLDAAHRRESLAQWASDFSRRYLG